MDLTLDQREQIATELKRFSTELGLSEIQKDQLETVLKEAQEKVQEFRQKNPNASTEELVQKLAENRSSLRERVVAFLTPRQLTAWDKEIARARESLGQKAASA